jgi:hypothetical protein
MKNICQFFKQLLQYDCHCTMVLSTTHEFFWTNSTRSSTHEIHINPKTAELEAPGFSLQQMAQERERPAGDEDSPRCLRSRLASLVSTLPTGKHDT